MKRFYFSVGKHKSVEMFTGKVLLQIGTCRLIQRFKCKYLRNLLLLGGTVTGRDTTAYGQIKMWAERWVEATGLTLGSLGLYAQFSRDFLTSGCC